MLLGILLQAGAVADSNGTVTNTGITSASGAVTAAATNAQEVISPLSLVLKGGWVMIPLFLFLLLAIYFAIERLIIISKARKSDANLMHNVKDYILNGKIDTAREYCRSVNSPVSRTIEKGISRLGKPTREVSEAMETHGRVEIARVEKNLHYLSLIARIAPMLGFIGTIAGVVTIFYDISLSGDISIKTISGGLYQKMVSSGAGLVIGVISFLFYHLLNSMVDGLAGKVERASLEFLDLINEPEK
ncbi:MAG: MotA/TolQ/ExbB proton channel family protein [Bacteroidetes bacterium]|jgi:biopolymer transport protein ExbB|nr:MotA/TolQ/ExbB proton channel family protein [Bacteroidota bacterium]